VADVLFHVTPDSKIVKSDSRYAFFGNRGPLHDRDREIRQRRPNSRGWIICRTDDLGEPDTFLEPGHMTELFFFDEATGFAAGHRPCFRCRYRDATQFLNSWRSGNNRPDARISDVDDVIHQEREACGWIAPLDRLPDGAFVDLDGPMVVRGGSLYRWSLNGYEGPKPGSYNTVRVITPQSVVEAFRSGFSPQIGIAAQ
jgi:hypothetical protein